MKPRSSLLPWAGIPGSPQNTAAERRKRRREEREKHREEEEKTGGEMKEQRVGRCLQLPQPSRLRPPSFPGSKPALTLGPALPQVAALSLGLPGPTGPPPTSRALRQPVAQCKAEKVKALPLGCGSSSRLPKPKSH